VPVFIPGATGYIGRSVVRALRRDGHTVRALARSDAADHTARAIGAEPVRGDLRDLDLQRAEAAHADAVVFLAQEQSAGGVAVAEQALEALLDALPDGRTFIYTSGVWVYGSRGDALVAEDAPLAPLPIVAWRPGHEQIALSHQGRLRVVVIRPGIVYGDGGGIVGTMEAAARAGKLVLIGDGANRWPTVRHDALADLFALAIARGDARGVYNATRGAAVPYGEVAHAVARAVGGDGTVDRITLEVARETMGGFADALASDLQIDSSRATRELGWEPHRPTLLEELSNTAVI
jgi:nucleoside-diphosphate-sugar epimerase